MYLAKPLHLPLNTISKVSVLCMHTCMYVCMYVCMYACMYVCMHACMYVCMHACMYVCMHTSTHIDPHFCYSTYHPLSRLIDRSALFSIDNGHELCRASHSITSATIWAVPGETVSLVVRKIFPPFAGHGCQVQNTDETRQSWGCRLHPLIDWKMSTQNAMKSRTAWANRPK